ncbi:apoptosis regulator BAX-like isoform X2 [Ornithodoros turicata]
MSIPIPFLRQTPTPAETQQEGRVLLSSFIGEQVAQEENLDTADVGAMGNTADIIYSHTGDREAGDTYESRTEALEMNPEFLRLGRELRGLADQFSRSPERRRVRREAESLNIDELTRDNLFSLMNELFRDGFSRERLVTFFFFCSDLILKALRQSVRRLRWQVVAWVWEFFRDRVCAWVCERGGWEAVLTSYLPKLAVTMAGVAVTILAAVCVWKMVRAP